ncbi:hypothetical protein FS842_005647 [Serendipita sp. 407]|nr:hypothetical protein FRC18_002628 [Serendipita sp. 400]KAG9023791.1 hypothetical protein FS842_005647 [Serendipita sp. 407]
MVDSGVLEFHDVPLKPYLEKLRTVHPGLTVLHCPAWCVTENIREIARCLPNLRDIGLLGRRFPQRFWRASSVMDHLAPFRMFSKLESISFPDISKLGISYRSPGTAFCLYPGLRDRRDPQAKEVTQRLLEGIEKEILTKTGPRLLRVVIGVIIYEVDANRRLRKRRRICREGRRRHIVVEEYVGDDEGGNGK